MTKRKRTDNIMTKGQRTDNIMTKGQKDKRTKGQTTIHKTLHMKQKIEELESH
jgi:hypothetical protein